MIHGFRENLEFSFGERESFDLGLLKDNIYGCTKIEKTNEELDKAGVDYIAYLRKGTQIYIDAKARKKGASKYWNYNEPELALETWSVCPTATTPGKQGWTFSEASNVDLILYTFDKSDTNKYYLIPFQLLRLAFIKNYDYWINKYKRKKEHSESWTSEAVFVPASVVLKAVSDEMQGCT